MKPIQKGLAIIAGVTLITVLAISFLGDGSKKNEQNNVVEADAKVEANEEVQGNTATDPGAAKAEGVKVQEQGGGVTSEMNSDSVAVSAEAELAKKGQSAPQNKAVVTSDAPAPPGPFHKNIVAGTPEMPAAPTAPTAENIDLPPPPMPQALIDGPTAPEANTTKPEFVKKPEMNLAAPEQPAAIAVLPEAPAALARGAAKETLVPTEATTTQKEQIEKSSADTPVAKEAEEHSTPVETVAVPAAKAVASTEAPVSMPVAPISMPEKPSAPMVPAEIQQSGVHVQGKPMPQYQQPRVIFVPVPVYPYQQPPMNQQWGGQAPQMNFMPPQPPVMGETAPAQGQ